MSIYKTDEYLSVVIVDFDYQTIVIALDIENHPVVKKNTGMWIFIFNVRR